MSALQHRNANDAEYLSWIPEEERIESVTGGPGPLTLVRSCGGACDDPASPYLGVQVLLDGEARLECDLGRGRFYKHFRRGDFAIVPPDTDISFEGPGTFQAVSLAIPKEQLAESIEGLAVSRVEECDRLFDRAHDDPRVPALVELLAQELAVERGNGDLFVDGLCRSLLATVLDLGGIVLSPPEERLGGRTLHEIRDYIRSSLDGAIRIEDLARLAGMSPSRFSQVFKQVASETPSQFVMRERVARATELLLQSRRPITEIAFATGFCDQSHLTRHFKRRMGHTPAAYRAARS